MLPAGDQAIQISLLCDNLSHRISSTQYLDTPGTPAKTFGIQFEKYIYDMYTAMIWDK